MQISQLALANLVQSDPENPIYQGDKLIVQFLKLLQMLDLEATLY
jgi:hypothetical protein